MIKYDGFPNLLITYNHGFSIKVQMLTAVKRHHDQGESYKTKHLIAGLLAVSEGESISTKARARWDHRSTRGAIATSQGYLTCLDLQTKTETNWT